MGHFHLHHGSIVDVLWKMNVWAQFLRFAFSLWRQPFPSNTSSFIIGSSGYHPKLSSLWISHFKYIVCKNLKLLQWNIHLLPFGCAIFPLYPFKVFLYHLMGYIHLITMESHKFNFFTRYITKYIMISKLGGNTFFIVDMVFATSSLNTSIVLGSITFAQILSKT